jgi:hypothetical protein
VKRRTAVGVLAGLALGWVGASLLSRGGREGDGGATDGETPTAAASSVATTVARTPDPTTAVASRSSTPARTTTEATSRSTPSTDVADPTDSTRATARATTPTPAGTSAASRRKVDATFRGTPSNSDERFTVLYTVRNDHSFAVRVTLRLSISLRDGSTRRETLTVDLAPSGVVNDSYAFEGYDSTVTGWSAGLASVEGTG